MSTKILILTFLILSFAPGRRAAKEDIYKFEKDKSTDEKNLVLEELVKKCFLNGQNFLVIAGEGFDDEFIGDLHRSEETAIVQNTSSKLPVEDLSSTSLQDLNNYYTRFFFHFQWQSSGFLVSAYSPLNLKEILDALKNSEWWNSAGYFLITDDPNNAAAPVSATTCSDAFDFLSLAWKYNILDAVFLCQEKDGNLSMYSFDPYGRNSVPSPWVKVRTVKGRRGHPWNLLKWAKYDGILNYSCSESKVFFDKKKSLNGYPLLVNAVETSPLLYFEGNETTGGKKYQGEDGWTMRTIWDTLNATLAEVSLAASEAMIGWIEDNGTVRGNLIDISSGKVDMGLNGMTVGRLNRKTTTAYPHTTLNACLVTKDRGAIPWLIGMIYVCDKWTMLCGGAVFLIAVLTFGYIDKRNFFSGFLNALRVFLSTSYVLPSSVVQPRVMICFLFLLPLVSYSTYQGKVLSLIRNPSHYDNIDTAKEVLQNRIRIEGPKSLLNFFATSILLPQYHGVEKRSECLKHLHNNPERLGCTDLCIVLMLKASRDKKLHVASEESDVYFPNRYVARPEFPMIDRFNEVLQRMVEAGLPEYYREQSLLSKMYKDKLSNDDDSSSNGIATTIGLNDFYYIFIGLGVGWSFAFVVFIIELILGRSKKPDRIIINNPEGIAPRLTAQSYQIIRRISRRENWPTNF